MGGPKKDLKAANSQHPKGEGHGDLRKNLQKTRAKKIRAPSIRREYSRKRTFKGRKDKNWGQSKRSFK